MDLSVILVSYRSPGLLLAGLRALRADAAATGLALDVVVVDHDSRDSTLEALAREAPEARVIANRENVGYARAVNQGLAATRGDFALVLNPDCEVHPGALRALLDHMAANPRAGLVGPRIVNPDGVAHALIHLEIPSWLWYSTANDYSFADGTTCTRHPCFDYRFFGTSPIGGVTSGSFTGSDFPLTPAKKIIQKGEKVFR